MTRLQQLVVIGSSAFLLILGIVASQLPGAGAGALLHPGRHRVVGTPPPTCSERTFAGDGVSIRSWQCRTSSPRRGTVVYLHGVADNRTSGAGLVDRFGRRGFDVIAYDSRAHGESEVTPAPTATSRRSISSRPRRHRRSRSIVLIGTRSARGRAAGGIAGSASRGGGRGRDVFGPAHRCDRARAFFFTAGVVARLRAGATGPVSGGRRRPVAAASTLRQPVLLIHGADDTDTRRLIRSGAGWPDRSD